MDDWWLQGAKPWPLVQSIAVGLLLRFVVPIPAGVTAQAWSLLAIFISTIAGQQVAGRSDVTQQGAGP